MTRVPRGLVWLVALMWAGQGPATLAAPKRPINEKDLFNFTWASDPQIAPDASQVAFVKVTVNKDKDTYETALWVVPTAGGEARRLTYGPHDSSPRWSPDSSRLAFIRAPLKDGKPQPPQVFILSLAGGEPAAVTSQPTGAASPVWSPDGKKLAFMSETPDEQAAGNGTGKDTAKAPDKPEHESDVRVVTLAEFRGDNQGYADPKAHAHIWTVAVPLNLEETLKATQITKGPFDEGELAWSADGARIYFLTLRVLETYYDLKGPELYSVAAAGGPVQRVAGIAGAIGTFALSRDGKRIAFEGVELRPPVRSYTPPALFVGDAAAGASPRIVTAAHGYDVGGGLVGDQHPPRGGGPTHPVWTPDGTGIITRVSREGSVNLQHVDALTGKIRPVTGGHHEVVSFSASADGSRLALLLSTPTNIGDVYLSDATGGPLRQLTHVNDKFFSGLSLTAPEELWYTSFDGKRIQAWLQKPPRFDPKTKYPLILNIHGGPHAAYGYTFFHEMQWMAAKGYLVLYPNPRGSSSYGPEFGNIIQYRYPGDDFKDLMAGVDEVVRRGSVDPARLGVTGGSGGGVLTNWIIGHTDRFAAAVSQRSIADWAAWWYQGDGTLFPPVWFKAPPFDDPAEYATRSPITYVRNVKTPLMLIEGESDYRAPPASGGEVMFRALKFLKKPVVMVRFPGESHELSRSGKPWHRVERLEHIVNWFDKYLQGKPMPQYELNGQDTKSAAMQP